VLKLGNINLEFGPVDVQVKLHTITCFQRSPRFRTTLPSHFFFSSPTASLSSNMEVISRALLVAREDESFWEKHKLMIIGGAIAIPIQLVAGFF
jgi:hypothetical protein